MKMSNNPAKYEVLIKQYLRSILDKSVFQNESKWKNHSDENEFGLHENENVGGTHFHINDFALRLVLKQRHKRTRMWPIIFARAYESKPGLLDPHIKSCKTYMLHINVLRNEYATRDINSTVNSEIVKANDT